MSRRASVTVAGARLITRLIIWAAFADAPVMDARKMRREIEAHVFAGKAMSQCRALSMNLK